MPSCGQALSGCTNHSGSVLALLSWQITKHVSYCYACVARSTCRAGHPIPMLTLSNFVKHHIWNFVSVHGNDYYTGGHNNNIIKL